MNSDATVNIDLAAGANAADEVPVLNEAAAPMDLPERATLNADGSVTLILEFPCVIEFRALGGKTISTESFDHLVLKRLHGLDMRAVLIAKNATNAALARSTGLSAAKLDLLLKKMDSADVGAAQQVINELLGGMKEGLPDYAEETQDGIKLPLLYPATDADGTLHTELMFKRMTGADRMAIAQAKDPLDWAVHRATGLSVKAAKGLIDDMDGADIVAVQAAIAFLSGSGRRTGR